LSTQLLGKATYQNNEEGSGAHFIITFKDSFLRNTQKNLSDYSERFFCA